MGKHSRKRQKVSNAEQNPLGSARGGAHETDKDDEERRLESILFGAPRQSHRLDKTDSDALGFDLGQAEGLSTDRTLEQLQDSDLFFVDDAVVPDSLVVPDLDLDIDEGSEWSGDGAVADEPTDSFDNDEAVGDAGPNELFTPDNPPQSLISPLVTSKKSRGGPAWADPDDAGLKVSLAHNKRLRKLRDAASEDTVSGIQYEAKLRREYERINPTPEWITNARKKLQQKRRRSSVGEDEGQVDETVDIGSLLASTSGLLSSKKSTLMPKGTLAIERLRDANNSAKAEGEIKSLAFNPSTKIPIMLTASADRRLRLFNVDGHTNPHIQTIHIPDLNMTKAMFHPSGKSIFLGGPRPFYYTYDLQSGQAVRSARGLGGATFSDPNQSHLRDLSMENCAFDHQGDILAVAGQRGYIHLFDWRTGAGQMLDSLKMNSNVKSLFWAPGSSSRRELLTLGDNAEVYVWDIGERRCVRRWKDEGGFGTKHLCGDRNGQYLTVGSTTGLVNVYSASETFSSSNTIPKPLKILEHLTTSISTLRFNHDSQLLAVASNVQKDQLRLIHLPSLTAFSNWPTSGTPLGHVTAVDFSAESEYVAVGNNRGRVLLYRLSHFGLR